MTAVSPSPAPSDSPSRSASSARSSSVSIPGPGSRWGIAPPSPRSVRRREPPPSSPVCPDISSVGASVLEEQYEQIIHHGRSLHVAEVAAGDLDLLNVQVGKRRDSWPQQEVLVRIGV